jgi:hypothetical protein
LDEVWRGKEEGGGRGSRVRAEGRRREGGGKEEGRRREGETDGSG